MTLPTTVRIRGEVPKGLAIHHADLAPGDVERVEGVPVTTPARSIRDAHASHLGIDLVGQAIADGRRSGALSIVEADRLERDMSAYLKVTGAEADEMMPARGEVPAFVPAAVSAVPPADVTAATRAQATQMLAALGGAGNIRGLAACAETRIRIEHGDLAIDEAALARSGVRGVMRLPHRVIHLVVGPDATTVSLALQALVRH